MILLLAIAGFGFTTLIVVIAVGRRLRKSVDQKPLNFDFTIGELRALRESGRMSEEEYQRAQAAVLHRSAQKVDSRVPVNTAKRGFDVLPAQAPERSPGTDEK